MGGKDVIVRNSLPSRELGKRLIESGREGGVLHLPNNFPIPGSGDIAQIAALVEVAERIKRHSLVSRR